MHFLAQQLVCFRYSLGWDL